MAATWSEKGKVHIWDLTRPLNAVNDSNIMSTYVRNEESPPPMFTFKGHQVEGFAIDWSPTTQGQHLRIYHNSAETYNCDSVYLYFTILHVHTMFYLCSQKFALIRYIILTSKCFIWLQKTNLNFKEFL